jgi:RND family efflux transporter MFP subunit
MSRLVVSLLLAAPLFAAAVAHADEPASVAVQTEAPRKGAVPDILVAYGTAAPALDGGMTISLQQDGQVMAIAVTPGESVQAGQRLLEFGASASASSTYRQAVSALALARTQRAHTAQLLDQRLATRDQLAQADKSVSDAQATLDALRREGAGSAEQALTAPFDGIVATIPVAQGDRVAAGTPLLTLTRRDGLVVTVGIEPADHARVRPGQPVTLQALDGGPPLTGQVLRVDAALNPKTRLLDADISVPTGAVISGEAFRAGIQVGQLLGWVVPHDAVLSDAKGDYVFQVNAGKAARVDVKLAGNAGTADVVDGPIDAGRKLVVQGNYQLDDGTVVHDAAAPVAGQ